MLSPLQIQKLLKHCENIEENYEEIEKNEGILDIAEQDRTLNLGWIQALRLVLENSTYPIGKPDDNGSS